MLKESGELEDDHSSGRDHTDSQHHYSLRGTGEYEPRVHDVKGSNSHELKYTANDQLHAQLHLQRRRTVKDPRQPDLDSEHQKADPDPSVER